MILVDGHALAYRAHFALFTTGMRTRTGEPTWAVYGFLNSLLMAIGKYRPDCLAVCFDLDHATFREQSFQAYKAHRKPMPDELRPQLDTIRTVVKALDIPIYEVPGYEADDVIGTIAVGAVKDGYEVSILTGDRDIFQLVSPGITVLLPQAKGPDLDRYDEARVFERMGVRPDQIVDYKGLAGDSSDNIPGVPGIGEKTAVALLSEFGSFDHLFANLDQVSKPKLREKLVEFRDQAHLSYQLARIDTAVPLESLDWQHCRLVPPDLEALRMVLERLEFKSILNNLPRLLAGFNNGHPIQAGSHQLALAQASQLSDGGGQGAHPGAPSPVLAAPGEPQGRLQLPGFPGSNAKPLELCLRIVDSVEALSELVEELGRQDLVAFDTETDGLSPLRCGLVGISMAFGSRDACSCQAVYIPIGHRCGIQLPKETVLTALGPFFASNRPKVAHHAKFDMHVLSASGIEVSGLVDDTLLSAYVSNTTARSVGLKELAWELLGYMMTPIADLIGKGAKQLTMDQVPIVQCAPYAAADAAVTLELTDHLQRRLEQVDCTRLYRELELPLIPLLSKMERHGIGLDEGLLRTLSGQLGERLVELEIAAQAAVGQPFNLGSPRQIETILFDKLQLPHVRKTKTGRSTDAAVLEDLQAAHPVVGLILEHRQLSKLKNTYIDVLPGFVNPRTGRVHTSYNQHIASTGRLSSDQPNLQNIPVRTELGRSIRRAFVPVRSGDLIFSADYSQIELRILAHVANDAAYLDAFAADLDIHAATAAQIFGIAEREVTSDMRRKAKAVNFGVAYGQTAFGLARTLGIPPREARDFIEAYRLRYPGVLRYTMETVARAHRLGYTSTLLGRRRHLPGLRSANRTERENAERAAINAPIQGTAADLIKLAMLKVDRALTAEGLEAALVLQVHDELVLEVPPSELERASELVRHEMEHALDGVVDLKVPLKVDLRWGPTWEEAK